MIRQLIRHATLIVILTLPTAIGAAEFAPRPSTSVRTEQVKTPARTEQFLDRFGGEKTKIAAAQDAPPKIAARPTLRAEATVVGDIVRIGDLIEHADAVADVAIFRAPDLGQTGTVPVSRIIDAILPHRIVNLDTRGIAEVVVTRASRLITAKDVEARIIRVLADQSGLADAKNLSVKFDNDVHSLKVEAAVTTDLRVMRLGYEPRNGRFDVTFDLPGSAIVKRAPLRFTGSIAETFETIVPTRQIMPGEVLSSSDLTLALRPKSEFAANVLLGAEQAIGLLSKRALRPGQVIRQGDLAKQQLVARGEAVTIIYEVPGIVVSIRGQALESGGLGDLINVLNVQSKKTIQATVSGPGRVNVTGTTARIADATPSSNNARRGAE